MLIPFENTSIEMLKIMVLNLSSLAVIEGSMTDNIQCLTIVFNGLSVCTENC